MSQSGLICTPSKIRAAKLGSFEEASENYLNALSTNAPDSTFFAHQSILRLFVPWCQDESLKKKGLQKDHIAQFADYLYSEIGHSIATVTGHLSSLSNFLAYLHQSNPDLEKQQIAIALHEYSSSELTEVKRRLITDCETTTAKGVKALLSYLRKREYGTRTHVYVELIQETRSRPKQIRQIDISDLALGESRVSVNIPETHVVSDVGLVTHRIADLSDSTVDAIETYLNYERKEVAENDNKPFFTTSSGRASPSTLRRSVKRASKSASSYVPSRRDLGESSGNKVPDAQQAPPVVPTDIWKSAISTISD